jgi:putative FmdB family regulatory protein
MPIYEYQCENGHEFEVMQKIGQPALESCPICLGIVHRKIPLVHQLKGAGIYFFDKRYGERDILHDPTFSDRERGEILSRTMSQWDSGKNLP